MASRIWVPLLGLLLLSSWTVMAEARNSKHAKYMDPKQPIEARIDDLLIRMTLEEKVDQMTQLERQNLIAKIMRKYAIRSILSGGGSVPRTNATVKDWVKMVNKFQKWALSSRLVIPMMYEIDAVHGNNNVYEATIFPNNIGLGATRQV
ncbi:beta-glucosidase [Sarracenia purpurea var. burkii]